MNHSSEARVALVTGGAKGIGAEVCARLASLGHQVLVADLDIDAAAATARELQAAGGRATAMALDVGKPESIAAVFQQVEREHGRCDMLVNSAGIAKVFPFLDFPLENFLATMNINVTDTLLCSQAATQLMAKNR